MQSVHQILSDCPACKVEAALVELYDPEQRLGVALEGRCRLCGYQAEFGEMRIEGQRFGSVFEVMAALDAWSAADGEEDVRQFTASNFQGLTPEQVAERVIEGKAVETGFDVIAWFFPNAGAGNETPRPSPLPKEAPAAQEPPVAKEAPAVRPAVTDAERREAALKYQLRPPEVKSKAVVSPTLNRVRDTPTFAPEAPAPRPRPHADAVARALVSVMMADGIAHPAEQRFIEAHLRKIGQDPLPQSEWRVWRPPEVGFVDDPAELIDLMRRLAMANGEVDGSEVRVIREFARAWQVPFHARSLPRSTSFEEIRRSLLSWFD